MFGIWKEKVYEYIKLQVAFNAMVYLWLFHAPLFVFCGKPRAGGLMGDQLCIWFVDLLNRRRHDWMPRCGKYTVALSTNAHEATTEPLAKAADHIQFLSSSEWILLYTCIAKKNNIKTIGMPRCHNMEESSLQKVYIWQQILHKLQRRCHRYEYIKSSRIHVCIT